METFDGHPMDDATHGGDFVDLGDDHPDAHPGDSHVWDDPDAPVLNAPDQDTPADDPGATIGEWPGDDQAHPAATLPPEPHFGMSMDDTPTQDGHATEWSTADSAGGEKIDTVTGETVSTWD